MMMVTCGIGGNLRSLLTDLIELDYDAAEACQAGINRLENIELRETMAEFRDDHLRLTRELGKCLIEQGHRLPEGRDSGQNLSESKVGIAGPSSDSTILRAILSNEGDTVIAYDRASEFEGVPPYVLELIARGRLDEHRHRDWIELRIGTLR